MKQCDSYVDLEGRTYDLSELDSEECELLAQLRELANHAASSDYANFWMPKVAEIYESRGLGRQAIVETPLFQVAQDLGNRLMVAEGEARPPDYRDELEGLIRARFHTRRAFCEATGLSEDMLSHVLARRKHLAVDTLSEALGKIGYALHIAPMQ